MVITVNEGKFLVISTDGIMPLYLTHSHDWSSLPERAKSFPTRKRAKRAADRAFRFPGEKVKVVRDPLLCPHRSLLVSIFPRFLFGG